MGEGKELERVRAIPNDNLKWRPNKIAATEGGENINLKDANLLKISTVWCQRLVVPGLDILIYQIVQSLNSSPKQSACQRVSVGSCQRQPNLSGFSRFNLSAA